MNYTRREFATAGAGDVAGGSVVREIVFGSALVQAKPNSMFNGVQIGTITYSYRSMSDQSAEATLRYVVDSGINAIELMGGPVNDYARKRTGFTPSAGAWRWPGGRRARRRRPGRRRARGRRVPEPAPPRRRPSRWTCRIVERAAVPGRAGWRWRTRGGLPEAAAGGAAAAAAPRGGGRGAQSPEQMAAAEEVRKWRQSTCRWTSSRTSGRCTTTPA